MGDLIDREAVREFIKSYRHSTDVAFDMEKRLDEIPPAPRWVRCDSGEWPEIGKLVLLYYGGCYSVAARTEDEIWEGKRYWKLDDGYWERIEDDYCWMPIEPPKEEA